MKGKVAVEEHFGLPETVGSSVRYAASGYWAEVNRRLLEVGEKRLDDMDAAGIEMTVLSLNPATEMMTETSTATSFARYANDHLAEQVSRHPDRLAALAALPMQDPEAAARELDRCIRQLGFVGALVNGFAQVDDPDNAVYYDLPRYAPFWSEVERLGVPFYLHPRDPLPSQRRAYDGHPWLLGSPWSFSADTSVHALRLICSGLFDRHPGLQIVLGHLGERIPYDVWRIDHRLKLVPNVPAKRPVQDYLRSNFHVTTSGHFSTASLQQAISVMGIDRVLFSVDYPFEDNEHAASWFDALPMPEPDLRKLSRLNAVKLFGLRLEPR